MQRWWGESREGGERSAGPGGRGGARAPRGLGGAWRQVGRHGRRRVGGTRGCGEGGGLARGGISGTAPRIWRTGNPERCRRTGPAGVRHTRASASASRLRCRRVGPGAFGTERAIGPSGQPERRWRLGAGNRGRAGGRAGWASGTATGGCPLGAPNGALKTGALGHRYPGRGAEVRAPGHLERRPGGELPSSCGAPPSPLEVDRFGRGDLPRAIVQARRDGLLPCGTRQTPRAPPGSRNDIGGLPRGRCGEAGAVRVDAVLWRRDGRSARGGRSGRGDARGCAGTSGDV